MNVTSKETYKRTHDLHAIRREGAQAYKKAIRVIIADDSPRVRAGIRIMLQNSVDIIVIGEAVDGVQAYSLTTSLRPDILLLDMEMPGMNGVQVVEKLNERGVSTRIVVLSAYDDLQYILGALNHGAAGYLIKEEVPDSLITAIRDVAMGKAHWVSARIARKLSAQ